MNNSQSGNIFAVLFGAVALVGVLAAAGMQLVTGPLRTMTAITQKNLVEGQLYTNARLVVIQAGIQANNGDADSDSFIEPVEYVPNGTGDCNTALVGGGCLPLTLGASLIDPFGSAYGYCVWDHGATDNGHADGAAAAPYRLNGNTDPTQPVIALISAGRDKTFQTTCRAYDGVGTDGVNRVVGSDDLVFTYTYAEASAASGGLWSIKPTDADTAEIAKDLEVKDSSNNVTVAIDRATGIGDFLGITTDVITAKTGNDITVEGLTEIEIPTDGGDILSLRNQDAPMFVFNSAYNSNHRLPIFEMLGTNDIGGTRGVAGIIEGNTSSTQWQASDAILQFNAKRGGGASTVGNLFNWMSNDSPVMTLSHEGNLGIGLNSPNERLSVYKPSTELINSTNSVVKITTNSMDNLGATADPTLLEVVGTFGGVPKGRLFEARNSTHTLSLRNDHTSFMRINRGSYTDAVTRAGGIAYPLLGLSYNDNLFDGYTPLLGQSIDLNVTSWGGSTSSYRDIYGTATKIRGAAPGVGGDFFGLYLDVDGGDKNYSVYAASGDAYFADNVGIGTATPQSKLDVAGGVKLGDDTDTCPGASNVKLGTLRFNSGETQVCQASGWQALGGSGLPENCAVGSSVVWDGSAWQCWGSAVTECIGNFTYSYTGGLQSLNIPADCRVTATINGAGGAASRIGSAAGGNGGQVSYEFVSQSAGLIEILVGRGGISSNNQASYGGGGAAGDRAGGGGGRSEISFGGVLLAIAGGGGGGGGRSSGTAGDGGDGGGTVGAAGGTSSSNSGGGGGGTQLAGGAGGTGGAGGGTAGDPGALDAGGRGNGVCCHGGGGGGGGFYGGGGGAGNGGAFGDPGSGGGGGGGSSYANTGYAGYDTHSFAQGNGSAGATATSTNGTDGSITLMLRPE